MERDIDYFPSDDWKYQFAKYPYAKDPDAYAHDERQRQAVLDIVATNLEAAKGSAPFDRSAISAFRQLMLCAVFGEYKTDTTGEVKTAFDNMRNEWLGLFHRLAKQYPAIAENVYSASESQDEFFDSWYAILDTFRYTDFVQYQRGEYDLANARLQEYVERANTLRLKIKAYRETGVDLRPVMEKLDDVKAAATRAADNTDKIIDELSVWREWIERGCKGGGKRNGNRSKLLKGMRDAILDRWKRYNEGEADCELPNGKLRRAKRAVTEFFEKYSATIIYTSKVDGKQWTLKQMCHTVKELETAIDSAQKSERRANKNVTKRKADKKNGQQKM